MSRAVDLLLLGAIALMGWMLLRPGQSSAEPEGGAGPITLTLQARGDASLDGLGVILRPAGGSSPAKETSGAVVPHQLTPWDLDRTAKAIVPVAGRYELRWGAQDEPPPGRPRDVMLELGLSHDEANQTIEITEGMTTTIAVDLDPARAKAVQALVKK